MAEAATLTIVINAEDRAAAALAAADKQVSSLGKNLSTLGVSAGNLGRTMMTGLTLPILAVSGYSAKLAVDFQQSMTLVRTQAGDTTDDIKKLSDQVLQLATHSQFSPDQLSQGLYHLASLGLRGADAMNALDTAQRMAAVGGANLEDTASALGAALVTGISGVQNYSQAAGTLNAIIGQGNMRMNDLVGALGTGVLSVFKNAGLSLKDFGAALATLTDNGMGAEESATRLRMTISLMQAPSQQARDALAAIGMTSNQMGLDMQTKGLIPALQNLQKHLLDTYGTTAEGKQKMAAALTEMFGGGRSSAAIQVLLDQLPRVQTKLKNITDQSGGFASDYAQQQETASAKFKTALASLQASAIKFGDSTKGPLASVFSTLAKGVASLANWFSHLSPTMQKFVLDAALIVAAVGPVLIVFAKTVKTIGEISDAFKATKAVISSINMAAMMNPWVLAIMAIVVIAALIVTHWNTVKKLFRDVADFIKEHWRDVGSFLLSILMAPVDLIVGAWHRVHDFFVGLKNDIVGAVKDAGSWLYHAGKSIVDGLINGIKDKVTGAIDGVKDLGKKVINAFRNVIGWHSPSTVFTEAGISIGQGLVLGIQNMQGMASAAAAKLLSTTNIAGTRPGASSPMATTPVATAASASSSNIRTDITIGQITISTPEAAREFFKYLDQDNILVRKGLSPARGNMP